MKVVLESSPYFRVISPNDVCNKVAPGMPSTFRILFTPEENKARLSSPLGVWVGEETGVGDETRLHSQKGVQEIRKPEAAFVGKGFSRGPCYSSLPPFLLFWLWKLPKACPQCPPSAGASVGGRRLAGVGGERFLHEKGSNTRNL